MADKYINVGLIGHKFMGKAHSHALKDLTMFFDPGVIPVMHTICGAEDDIGVAAERFGWKKHTKDWREVIGDPEISAVSIAAPVDLHREIAVAAAKAGKHVFCEKPLAVTSGEAAEMYAAAEKYKIINMVDFNYRRVPAVRLAKQFIEGGRIGKVYLFKGFYLQDWLSEESVPYQWKLDKSKVGRGPSDIGSHIVDLARYLVGEFKEISGMMEIFIKERRNPADGMMAKVTADDASVFTAIFENGALGVFNTSRISRGNKNELMFEVSGSLGSIRFNLRRLNELEVCFDRPGIEQGFKNISVTEEGHEYARNWWPSGHIIGWEHATVHQFYEFFKAIANNGRAEPDFYDGMKTQEIMEAIEMSSEQKTWIHIRNMKPGTAGNISE